MVFTQRPGRGGSGDSRDPYGNEPYISSSRAMTGPIRTNDPQGAYPQQNGPYGPQQPYDPNYQQPYGPNAYGHNPYGNYNPNNNYPQQPYGPQGYQQPNFGSQQQPHPQQQRPSRSRQQDDLKGLSFWQEDEENAYYDEAEEITERSSPIKFAVTVGALVVLSSLLWLGYRWATKSDVDPIPYIAADQTPYKVRPEQQNGMNFPHQDMLVYGRLSPNQQNVQSERIMPQEQYHQPQQQMQQVAPYQEQPQQYAQQQNVPQQDAQAFQQQFIGAQGNQPQQQMQQVAPYQQQPQQYAQQQGVGPQQIPAQMQQAPAIQQQAPQQVVEPAQQVVQQPLPTVQNQQEQKVEPKVELKTVDSKKEQASPSKKEVKADVKKTTSESKSSLDAGFYIQLASLPKEESARSQWERIVSNKKYAQELGDLQPYIRLSEQGVKKIYTLLVGPFSDRDAALKKCVNLIKGCKVIEVK